MSLTRGLGGVVLEWYVWIDVRGFGDRFLGLRCFFYEKLLWFGLCLLMKLFVILIIKNWKSVEVLVRVIMRGVGREFVWSFVYEDILD